MISKTCLLFPPHKFARALEDGDEGSGTIAHDSSGNNNTGTLLNGATFSTNVPVNPIPLTGAGEWG